MDNFSEDLFVNLNDDNDLSFSNTDNSDESNIEVHKEVEVENDKVDVHSDQYKSLIDLTPDDILGMEFSSEHEAYKFYFSYAKCHGFGIRKDEIDRDSDHNIIMRQYLCNKAGLRSKKYLSMDERKKDHRPLTRTNCKARLRVRLDNKMSTWKVVSFEETHNHDLCGSNFVPLIRSYRGLTDADKAQVDCLHAHGVRTCHIMGYMMDQKGGHAGLGFNKKDLFNHIERHKRAKVKDGDVLAALSYLQGKADNDPMFFSKYILTDDGKLKHLFWADGTSRSDFQCFGDVVAFDSTYKKNKYNKPLVIFSGKNHHSQTVVFGCALVSDESTDTYEWVLQSFLDGMCNKKPKAIVTDGDGAMREAIKQVFPNASHRLCAWHLQKNACENIKNSKFLADFKRAMYGNFSPDRFEIFWKEMVVKHQLEGNNWISQTYQKRFMWATAYLRDKFFAGIRTTSLCEGINSIIKSYIRRKNTIVELLANFEHALRDYRYKELVSDFNSFYTEPVLTTSLPKIEQQVSKIFTRDIFKQVKSEIVIAGALDVSERSENVAQVIFKVNKFCDPHIEHEVVYDKLESKFACDCMLYESCGIPCSHIICVMRLEHIDSLPTSLICKRWLKDAKNSFISGYQSEEMDNDMMIMARFGVLVASCNRLCDIASKKRDNFNLIRNEILKLTHKLQKQGDMHTNDGGPINDVCDPNVVKTKGAPRKKSYKKKNRKCSNCNRTGHVVTTCPTLFSMDDQFSITSGSSGSESSGIRRVQENENEQMPIEESNEHHMTHTQQRIRYNDNKRRREVGGRAMDNDKKQRCFNKNVTKDNSKRKGTVSGYVEAKDVNPNSSTQKAKDSEIKHTSPFSIDIQQIQQNVDLLPPQQYNSTFTYSALSQGTTFPLVHGLVPLYPQFSQVSPFQVPNSTPTIMNYSATHNINGSTRWIDLLQEVMKGERDTSKSN